MATLNIPYNNTNYPLYLTDEKTTSPALKVEGLGYAPLYPNKNFGDPILVDRNLLKCSPLKITSQDGTIYRPTWLHGILGDSRCTLTYSTNYSAVEGSQVVRVCTRYNQYGHCIAYGNQTQYRYYWALTGLLKLSEFTVDNADCRLVISSATVNNIDVHNTDGSVASTSSAWGNWTTTRYSNYPTKPTTTLTATATGNYDLQIDINGVWVTIKSGEFTAPIDLSFNNTSTQTKQVILTLL